MVQWEQAMGNERSRQALELSAEDGASSTMKEPTYISV